LLELLLLLLPLLPQVFERVEMLSTVNLRLELLPLPLE